MITPPPPAPPTLADLGGQPSDSDLTAIAALSTTTFGRALLALADGSAALTAIGAQPSDADLAAVAALTTTVFGRGILDDADATAARVTLGLIIGTNVQAWDADLDTLAVASASAANAASARALMRAASRGGDRSPAGCIAETIPRGAAITNVSSLTSGGLRVTGLPLCAGDVVTTLHALSGTTPAALSTHLWFVLIDPSLVPQRFTADDTASSPWAANTLLSKALTSQFTALVTGMHYFGIVSVATTPPSLHGNTSTGTINGLAPVFAGNSNTGLTDPASCPNPVTAPTGATTAFYGYAS